MNQHLVSATMLSLLTFHSVLAEVRNVPDDYPTIQAAIDDCNEGDTVIVAPGIYTGVGNRDIRFGGKAITVRSEDPNDPNIVMSTVVDCNGTEDDQHCGFVFDTSEDLDSVLSGLTITRGYHGHGGAIYGYDYASPCIINCHIVGNHAYRGGGIYMANGNPVIRRCLIEANSAGFSSRWGEGGGLYLSHHGLVSDCIIARNTAIGIGANPGSGGGIHIANADVQIMQCTVVDNFADHGGGIYCNKYGNIAILGCILWGNTAEASPQISGTPSVSFCDVQGGFSGSSNLESDPLFVSPGSGDYHLTLNSPCIDSGDPNLVPAKMQRDVDQQHRVMGIRVDIGADETEGAFIPVMDLAAEHLRFNVTAEMGAIESRTLGLRNAGSGVLRWSAEGTLSWLSAEPTQGVLVPNAQDEIRITVNTQQLVPGVYESKIHFNDSNASNNPQAVLIAVFVRHPSGILAVPSDYLRIQGAVSAAQDGDTVIVAPGTYAGDGNRDIEFEGKQITVCSIDPTNPSVVAETVIDCQGSSSHWHRGFVFNSQEDANSILAGLTITGGYALNGAGILIQDAGPTIRDCVIRGNVCGSDLWKYRNSPKWGGGVYIDRGNPRVINCRISENVCLGNSTRGGGIACINAEPTIKGCVVAANETRDAGGGVYCYRCQNALLERCVIRENEVSFRSGGGVDWRSSDGILRNCVIVENRSSYGGAGVHMRACDANVVSCTIAYNSASGDLGGGIYHNLSRTTIRNSIVWVNTSPDNAQIHAYSWRGYFDGPASPLPTVNSVSNVVFSNIQDGENGVYIHGEPGWFLLDWGDGNTAEDPCFAEIAPAAHDPGPRSGFNIDLEGNVHNDYHLKSQAGRWDPLSGSWVKDDVTSPCIDAGDPNSPIGDELQPNGSRINMGAYGGTVEASKSHQGF